MLVIVLVTSFILLALGYVAARRRHFLLSDRTRQNQSEKLFSNAFQPKAVSFLAPDKQVLSEIENQKRHRELAEQRDRLLTWASLVDFSALAAAHISAEEHFADKAAWRQALTDALGILLERAERERDFHALASFVLANKQFNVNRNLIERYQQLWENAPDLRTTTNVFLLAAKADDADLYLDALICAKRMVKSGELNDISADELDELAESHHWLLSDAARTSGAGFLLKQKLANSRRKN